jgi:hypothetical protein
MSYDVKKGIHIRLTDFIDQRREFGVGAQWNNQAFDRCNHRREREHLSGKRSEFPHPVSGAITYTSSHIAFPSPITVLKQRV